MLFNVVGLFQEMPAWSTGIIAVAAIATRRVDYEMVVPIIPPPLVEAPVQHPSPPSPKAVHHTASRCNRQVKADPPLNYFACDNSPLCALHVCQLCVDCQRILGRMRLL